MNIAPAGCGARLVFVASLVAGVSYIASWSLPLGLAAGTLWKGAGVGLLAACAALQARNTDGWLITAVLAFGALGDALIEVVGLQAGAVAFVIGHGVAIGLYVRNRRAGSLRAQWLSALLLAAATVGLAALLPADRSAAPGIAFYTAWLVAMAAAAWHSRFPRGLVGCGAMLFVVSDLLIFARLGPLADAAWVGLAIWVLYFAAQVLICLGVTSTLAIGTHNAPPRPAS